MRTWFWSGALVLVGGAVGLHLGVTHAVNHPQSVLGRWINRARPAQLRPLVALGPVTPEQVLPLPPEVREDRHIVANVTGSTVEVVEPIRIDFLPPAQRILTEDEPPVLTVAAQGESSEPRDLPTPVTTVPLMPPPLVEEFEDIPVIMPYADDDAESATALRAHLSWKTLDEGCQVVGRSLVRPGILSACMQTGLQLIVASYQATEAPAADVSEQPRQLEVVEEEADLPRPVAPIDYHHMYCPYHGGCPYPYQPRYYQPPLMSPQPAPAATPASTDTDDEASGPRLRHGIYVQGRHGAAPRLDTMECRPDDFQQLAIGDRAF